MNADGTGQTASPTTPRSTRARPSSPDGTKIAFAQRPRRQLRDLRDERRRHRADPATNNSAIDCEPDWGRRPAGSIPPTIIDTGPADGNDHQAPLPDLHLLTR